MDDDADFFFFVILPLIALLIFTLGLAAWIEDNNDDSCTEETRVVQEYENKVTEKVTITTC